MGFPENILADDEQVVRKLNPHWLTVLVPALLGIVIIAVAVVIVLLTPEESPWPTINWIVIAVAVVLLLALVVIPFLKWRTTHYVITTKRVVVRRGILSKSGKDIALSKITDVSFHQSLWDRILRSGSLTIESAGDGVNEMFSNIPRSNEIQQLVNRLVEDELDRRGFGGGEARQHFAQVRHAEQQAGGPSGGRWESWDSTGAHPTDRPQHQENRSTQQNPSGPPQPGPGQYDGAPPSQSGQYGGPPPQRSGQYPSGPPPQRSGQYPTEPPPPGPNGGWETPPTR